MNTCVYCNTSYSTNTGITRHMKTCVVRLDLNRQNRLNNLIKENREQKNLLKEMYDVKQKPDVVQIITNNITTNNTVNYYNITIHEKETLVKSLDSFIGSFVDLFKTLGQLSCPTPTNAKLICEETMKIIKSSIPGEKEKIIDALAGIHEVPKEIPEGKEADKFLNEIDSEVIRSVDIIAEKIVSDIPISIEEKQEIKKTLIGTLLD